MFYLVGKQSLRALLKVIHPFSGRVDHSVNLSSQFSSSAVNHHLNSARKELIYFTPSFKLTNGVEARFAGTAGAHASCAQEAEGGGWGWGWPQWKPSLLWTTYPTGKHSEHGLLALCTDIQKEIRTCMLLLLSTLVLMHCSTDYSGSVCTLNEELDMRGYLRVSWSKTKPWKKGKNRKIMVRSECLRYTVRVPSCTPIEKHFFPAFRPGKAMPKQWKSNPHLEEKWLGSAPGRAVLSLLIC